MKFPDGNDPTNSSKSIITYLRDATATVTKIDKCTPSYNNRFLPCLPPNNFQRSSKGLDRKLCNNPLQSIAVLQDY